MNRMQTQGPFEDWVGLLVTTSLNWNAAHGFAPALAPEPPQAGRELIDVLNITKT